MIMAAAAMIATSAMAQNPEALKQIKKVKTAEEAVALINQNEASMTAAENAQAYAKLTDLYMVPVSKTESAIQEAQMAGKEAQYDKAQYAKDICNACQAALACDKYDMQPNEKGKVAPKFRNKNAERLYNFRIHLIIAGQDYLVAEDYASSAPLFMAYAETGYAPMFQEKKAAMEKLGMKDEYLGQTIDTAARLYTQLKDYKKAMQCGEILCQDPETREFGMQVRLNAIQASAETSADSARVLNELKEVYTQNPNDAVAFTYLAQWMGSLNMNAEQEALVEDFITKNPTNINPYLFKGQNAMNAQKYDEAIDAFCKAVACDTDDKQQYGYAYTYAAYCNNQKASNVETQKEQDALLQKSIEWLEKAREFDPNRERANWAYPLYQCYYAVYGENDARTKELESMVK